MIRFTAKHQRQAASCLPAVAAVTSVSVARLRVVDAAVSAWVTGLTPSVTSTHIAGASMWWSEGEAGKFAFNITSSCSSSWPMASISVMAFVAVLGGRARLALRPTLLAWLAAIAVVFFGNAVRCAIVASGVAIKGPGTLAYTHETVGTGFGVLIFSLALLAGWAVVRLSNSARGPAT